MKKGFSLIELLIVLAVVGLLISSVTIFAVNSIKKAKATAVARGLKSIALALEDKILTEGPQYFDNFVNTEGLSIVVENSTGEYNVYLLSKRDGEVFFSVTRSTSGVDVELVSQIIPGATVAEEDLRYELQRGDTFYLIRHKSKMKVSIGKVTVVPKGTIYIERTIRLF